MRKREEKVLLYQFSEDAVSVIKDVLRKFGVQLTVLEPSAWHQRIGFLFALQGFCQNGTAEDTFSFPYETAVFHNIKGRRLDHVLKALKDAGIAQIKFKAVTTPFNLHWTFGYLCKTIYKEHSHMMKNDKKLQ